VFLYFSEKFAGPYYLTQYENGSQWGPETVLLPTYYFVFNRTNEPHTGLKTT